VGGVGFQRFWAISGILCHVDVFVVKYVVFEALSVIFVVFYHQFTRSGSVFVLSFRNISSGFLAPNPWEVLHLFFDTGFGNFLALFGP